ncbi:10880_t:CDS:10 [Diversispora eburnea]|uniref:10880_t:CDS:1 n=1 Tax=Diversispora eburnea TaxID=1213867 RepID=A0A9N9AZX3_9GLOM|nr:10880_t:CDS:10 [Diversispora eburnea]
MLLWELFFEKMPYEKWNILKIKEHVLAGKREKITWGKALPDVRELQKGLAKIIVSAKLLPDKALDLDGFADLPDMYMDGEGNDHKKASELFKEAADDEISDAQLLYAFSLVNNPPVKFDREIFLKYITKAADNKNPTAQFNLGEIYLHDIDDFNIDEIPQIIPLKEGIAAHKKKEYAKAWKFFSAHAELENATAKYWKGCYLWEGIGVEKDHKKAGELLKEAADSGIDEELVKKYLRLAALNDQSKAKELLRKLGINGRFYNSGPSTASESKTQDNKVRQGTGIALVIANIAKLNVKIYDTNPKQIEKGLDLINNLIEKEVSKQRITREHAESTKSRIGTISIIEELDDTNFIIEAVSENINLKCKIFENLDNILKKDTILATNTSSISITKIAAATKRPEKVIGMHFMNPVPVMKLVEIIPGLATSEETLNITKNLTAKMGKTYTQSQDVPGFIANRLLIPYINEAIIALEQGIGTKEDIDTTMKLGTNVPMGPLALADFIGLDTCLAIMKVLHNEIGDTKYRPAVLLQKYVDAGWKGKKCGRGFYQY